MANSLYDAGREGILDGSISVTGDTIKVLLVTGGYAPNVATHRNVSDVGSGNITARSPALTGKTETGGVLDAADVTLPSIASGPAVVYVVLYKDTGVDSGSRLIGIIDTANGLPITPNGGDITIGWDNGTNRIFKL